MVNTDVVQGEIPLNQNCLLAEFYLEELNSVWHWKGVTFKSFRS